MPHENTRAEPQSASINRRDFHALTMAALSGAVAAGASAEAAEQAAPQPPAAPQRPPQPVPQQPQFVPGHPGMRVKPKDVTNPLLIEPHVCRGLNTCRGKGRGGQNACAGQGYCATAPTNTCGGNNLCRGLGACVRPPQPYYPGENTCKGKGGCEVPMLPNHYDMWRRARARFEWLMADMGRKVGPAPP